MSESDKETERTKESKNKMAKLFSWVSIALAILGVFIAWQANQQTQEQLTIAKQQISVPKFIEAIKLLERKNSFLSQKTAIDLLENLAINNLEYTQQSVNTLLSLNEWMSKKIKDGDYYYLKIFSYETNNNQEKVSREVLKSIAKIITNKNVQKIDKLDLSNANLCSIKLSDFKPTTKIKLDLSYACLIGSNLTNIDFKNANLSETNFSASLLNNIDFSNNKTVNSAFFYKIRNSKLMEEKRKEYMSYCADTEKKIKYIQDNKIRNRYNHRGGRGIKYDGTYIDKCVAEEEYKASFHLKVNFTGVNADSNRFFSCDSLAPEIKFIGNNPCKQKKE